MAGLDAIRFVCALWVVFFHAGFLPLTAGVGKSTYSGLAVHAIQSNLFNGSAAVIVFFLISGFVIHYPYVEKPETRWGAYFTRRYLRILIPMAGAYAVAYAAGVGDAEEGVMWSLRCELVYYTLYPMLAAVARKRGWNLLIAVSLIPWIAAVVIRHSLREDVFQCAAGLPCWLLGAKLAQNIDTFPSYLTRREIWTWRLGIWGLASLISFLHFHSPIHSDVSLTLFAFPVYYWLGRELQYFRAGGYVWKWLAWGGLWSYSIYIIHVPAMQMYDNLHLETLGYVLDWARKTGFILAASYLFYLVVEKPGHWVARRAQRAPRPSGTL